MLKTALLKPASFSWLFAHEIKLLWRGSLLLRTSRHILLPVAVVGILFQAAAFGIVNLLHAQALQWPVMVLAANINLLFLVGLMLARAMTAAIDVLYARGDSDFLLTAPLEPFKILAVRMLGVAALVASPWVLLAGVLANALALAGHPQALGGAYIAIPALAMAATATAFALVVSLVGFIGPTGARFAAHGLSLLFGLVIFILGQIPRYIPASQIANLWRSLMPSHANATSLAWVPGRALLGEAPALGLFCLACFALFSLVLFARAGQFASGAIAANATASPAGRLSSTARLGRFPSTPMAAAITKNLRILLRFPGLATQTVYRSLALVPVTMVLTGRVMIGTSPLIIIPMLVFLTGQLSLFFISIITGSDQSPQLLASAPVYARTGRNAAYAAAAYACLLVMALPIIGVMLRQRAGLAVLLACMAACLVSNLMLGEKFPIPLLRPAFGKTQTGTVMGLVFGVAASSFWALIAWLLISPAVTWP